MISVFFESPAVTNRRRDRPNLDKENFATREFGGQPVQSFGILSNEGYFLEPGLPRKIMKDSGKELAFHQGS